MLCPTQFRVESQLSNSLIVAFGSFAADQPQAIR